MSGRCRRPRGAARQHADRDDGTARHDELHRSGADGNGSSMMCLRSGRHRSENRPEPARDDRRKERLTRRHGGQRGLPALLESAVLLESLSGTHSPRPSSFRDVPWNGTSNYAEACAILGIRSSVWLSSVFSLPPRHLPRRGGANGHWLDDGFRWRTWPWRAGCITTGTGQAPNEKRVARWRWIQATRSPTGTMRLVCQNRDCWKVSRPWNVPWSSTLLRRR